ncbi:Hok/Gef family protein [Salmonella enterica]|nr:Hok/Gef family protein [Salmonella enterica]
MGCLEIQGASLICVTILCFVWMVRDSLCGLRLQQGNTVLVATLAYEVKR